MQNNLLTVLLTTAKAKITPIVTKIKLWTSWNFIRTRVIAGIRNFFAAILNIKPRHKADYYEVFGWLISRRLIFAALLVMGLASAFYLISVGGVYNTTETAAGIRTYDYDSLMLRFTKGKVRIRGKSGYLAYEGEVAGGAVNGFGTLYSPDGNVVYQGNFENNMYQGNGTGYYDNGIQAYAGAYEKNQYHGAGRLYRENGSLHYEGDFVRGAMEGTGKLYDNGNNPIYKGSFSGDEIVYSELLGKAAGEVKDFYTGSRSIYESEDQMVVSMDSINAMYVAKSDEEALDDSIKTDKIIVLKNTFGKGSQKCSTIAELDEYFESAIYEGNSKVTLGEAIAINKSVLSADDPVQKVEMEMQELYSDYSSVESLQEDYIVYINSYYREGLVYTFVRDGSEEGFLFYTIEADQGEAK